MSNIVVSATVAQHLSENEILASLNTQPTMDGGLLKDNIYIPPSREPFNENREIERDVPFLRIKKLKVINFKSTNGKIEVDLFKHQFNAIIGQNGVHRSDFMAAISFLFNQIGNGPARDFIFEARKDEKNIFCAVEAVFATNSGRKRNIRCLFDDEYETISVERIGDGNNATLYHLGRSPAQLDAVKYTLNKVNMNLSGMYNFFIKQNNILTIVNMKPLQLLTYLEDACGTANYTESIENVKVKIEQMKKLQNGNLASFQLAEKKIRELSYSYSIALEYLVKKNQLVFFKNIQLQKLTLDYNLKNTNHLKERDELTLAIDQNNKDIENTNAEIEKLTNQMRQAVESNNAVFLEIADGEKKLELHKTTANELSIKIRNIRKTYKQEEKTIDDNEEILISINTKLDRNRRKYVANREDLQHTSCNLQRLRKNVNDLTTLHNEELEPLLKQRKDIKSQITEVKCALAESKSYVVTKEQLMKHLQDGLNAELSQYKFVQMSYSSEKVLHRKLLSDMEKHREELISVISSIETKKLSLIDFQNQKERQENVLVDLAPLIEFTAPGTEDKVLDFLKYHKSEAILGRLYDFCRIASEFNVALASACPHLHFIVVDTAQTARDCRDLLNKYRVGFAKFLPIDAPNSNRYDRNFRAPGTTRRLIDLVQILDIGVFPIFYNSLGDTLVVKDCNEGNIFAYKKRKRYRCVTRDGVLYEPSGVVSLNRLDLPSKEERMIKTDVQIKAEVLQYEINYSTKQIGIIESELKTLSEKQEVMNLQLNKMSLDMLTAEYALTDIYQGKQRHLQDIRDVNVQINKLMQDILADRTFVEHKQQNLCFLQDEYKKVGELLDGTYGQQLRSAQCQLSTAMSKSKRLVVEQSNLSLHIMALERHGNEVMTLNEPFKREHGETLNKQKSMQTQLEQNRIEQRQIEQHEITLEASAIASQNEIKDLADQLKDMKSLRNVHSIKQLELEHDSEILTRNLSKVTRELKDLQTEAATLNYSPIPGEENQLWVLEKYSPSQLADYSIEFLNAKLNSLGLVARDAPDLTCIKEFTEQTYLKDKYDNEYKKLSVDIMKYQQLENVLVERRKREFLHFFALLTNKIREIYKKLAGASGEFKFEFIDAQNPYSNGITYLVRPPSKPWTINAYMSELDSTVAALSIIFGVHEFKKIPLLFLDQIDDNLDSNTLQNVGFYIKNHLCETLNKQVFMVTQRPSIYELSDNLIGYYFFCSASSNGLPRQETNTVEVPADDEEIIL